MFRASSFGFRAFTLLEVMLAVAILAIISTTIFRFTETTLAATRLTARDAETQQALAGLNHLLQAQLDGLAAGLPGALNGGSRKLADQPADELTLICDSPNALLSRRAHGPWRCLLTLRPGAAAPGRQTLGLLRVGPADIGTDPAANPFQGPDDRNATSWTPLLENIAGLEINYFNSRLNGWLPKWNDANALPDLLRVRLTFADGRFPFESVLRVPPRARQPAIAPLNPGVAGRPGAPGVGGAPGTPGQPPPTLPRRLPGTTDD